MEFSPLRRGLAPGFTLLELVLVIVVVAVIAGIVIIAINPAQQIAPADNARRSSDVNTILNAIGQYRTDHHGALPPSIGFRAAGICQTQAAVTSSCVDLSALTENQMYLVSLPSDPTSSTVNLTGYDVSKSSDTVPRVTVSAPAAELGEMISVSR